MSGTQTAYGSRNLPIGCFTTYIDKPSLRARSNSQKVKSHLISSQLQTPDDYGRMMPQLAALSGDAATFRAVVNKCEELEVGVDAVGTSPHVLNATESVRIFCVTSKASCLIETTN